MAEFREYARTSTTVINAALGPIMDRYLSDIASDARVNGLKIEPKIMQSNGGVASPRSAAKLPISVLASGPAAGVIGAVEVARKLGKNSIITFDVGGTTADVCLVENFSPLIAIEREYSGYPVRFPTIDTLSVGAGGGSIAWLDAGGFLHVGPESAGADPGPACYGRGGTEPTVTDANLVLGRLNAEGLLGGRMQVDMESAREAIRVKIAEPNKLDVEEAAMGILTIVNENMVQAVRVISVERGFDPREFSLFAYGGGGPLLACKLAKELGMREIIIPCNPGILCAEGLLTADTRADFSLTRLIGLRSENEAHIRAVLLELEERGRVWFDSEVVPGNKRVVSYVFDIRYQGQSHELQVDLSANGSAIRADVLKAAFDEEHKKAYGFANDLPMEIVTSRLLARIPNQNSLRASIPSEPMDSQVGMRQVYFDRRQGFIACHVHERSRISAGTVIHGPAIIEQMDSTTVVEPSTFVEAVPGGELILRFH